MIEKISQINEIGKERWKFNELGERFNLVEKFYDSSARLNWAKHSGREYDGKALVLSEADFDQKQSTPTLSSIVPHHHEVKKVQEAVVESVKKCKAAYQQKKEGEIPSPPSGLLARIRQHYFHEHEEEMVEYEFSYEDGKAVELEKKKLPERSESEDLQIKNAIKEMQRARKKKASGKFDLSNIRPSL